METHCVFYALGTDFLKYYLDSFYALKYLDPYIKPLLPTIPASSLLFYSPTCQKKEGKKPEDLRKKRCPPPPRQYYVTLGFSITFPFCLHFTLQSVNTIPK
jgi:hypothetical protein